MTTDSSDTDAYRHIVDLACPDCYPNPIETVLLYSLGDNGEIASIRCAECGKTGKPEEFAWK